MSGQDNEQEYYKAYISETENETPLEYSDNEENGKYDLDLTSDTNESFTADDITDQENDQDTDTESLNSIDIEDMYECAVPKDQFDDMASNYLNYIKTSDESRMKNRKAVELIEKQMQRVYTRNTVLFCIDIEAWERNTNFITEVGIAIYDPRDQELALTPNIKTFHIIIEENRHLVNGKFVPDNSQNFQGGPSWYLSEADTRYFIQELINNYFHPDFEMHTSLVGHDLKGDLKWLRHLGVNISHTVRKLDTQKIYVCTHGRKGSSLRNALRAVNQPYAYLHNAGNDAYFTVMLALKLCDPHVRHLTRIDHK